MSMSLDGFIAGPNAGIGNGLGDGGDRLHEWSFDGSTPVHKVVVDAFLATGEKNVMVHGAAVAQLALAAGLLDELEIHVIPVLLGKGRRLFGDQRVELERMRVLEGEQGVTHVRYRVVR